MSARGSPGRGQDHPEPGDGQAEQDLARPQQVGDLGRTEHLELTEAYGVDNDVAAAAGIAAHALTNLPVLLLGLAFLGREGLSVSKVANMSEAAGETR